MSNTRLVFSTDPRDQVLCPNCRKLKSDCTCKLAVSGDISKTTVIFRMEKGGRGGKTVTVLDGFPKNEALLKELSKELKAKCGVGGTFKFGDATGMIEIQGDQRVKIKAILDAKGIRYKGM